MKFGEPDTDAPDREAEERKAKQIKTEDLMSRHLIIVPKSIEWKKGDDGDNYESITADVIVLSGRKNDKIPTLPFVVIDKYLGGKALVAELREFLPGEKKDWKVHEELPIGELITKNRAHFLEKADGTVSEAAIQQAWARYEGQVAQNQEPPF